MEHHLFFPDYYYKSAYSIDYQHFYDEGKRGIIFDIDNTLVEHGYPCNDRALQLMKELNAIGFKVCFVSNNKEPRVKSFNDVAGQCYVYKAGKPGKRGYLKACELMDIDISRALFVGDQIFTDTWGASLLHITSCLVKPIARHEEIQIVLKRILEKPILFCFRIFRKDRCFL